MCAQYEAEVGHPDRWVICGVTDVLRGQKGKSSIMKGRTPARVLTLYHSHQELVEETTHKERSVADLWQLAVLLPSCPNILAKRTT